MQCLRECVGYQEIHSVVYQVLRTAKKHIYISCRRINFNIVLKYSQTLADVLIDRGKAGVFIMILVGEELFDQQVEESLDAHCKIKLVPFYGPKLGNELLVYTKSVQSLCEQYGVAPAVNRLFDKGSFCHSQNYILVDGKWAMLGSLGLDPEEFCRNGGEWSPISSLSSLASWPLSILAGESKGEQSNKKSQSSLLYHGIACLVEPSKVMCEWVIDNWQNVGESLPSVSPLDEEEEEEEKWKSKIPSLMGSFRTLNTELDVLHQFILNTKHSLYIETRYFVSTNFTHNLLARALANRLVQSAMVSFDKDPFRCIVLTNASPVNHLPEDNRLLQLFQTVDFLSSVFETAQVDLQQVKKRFFLGHLFSDKAQSPVYINSTLVVRDEKEAILTQTSLSDVDLGKRSSKVGCHVVGDLVPKLLARAVARHIKPTRIPKPGSDFFSAVMELCYQECGCIRRVKKQSRWTTSLNSFRSIISSLLFGESLHSLVN